jgi:hypothetical protein
MVLFFHIPSNCQWTSPTCTLFSESLQIQEMIRISQEKRKRGKEEPNGSYGDYVYSMPHEEFPTGCRQCPWQSTKHGLRLLKISEWITRDPIDYITPIKRGLYVDRPPSSERRISGRRPYQLKQVLQSTILRRHLDSAVVDDLPDKTEFAIYLPLTLLKRQLRETS